MKWKDDNSWIDAAWLAVLLGALVLAIVIAALARGWRP